MQAGLARGRSAARPAPAPAPAGRAGCTRPLIVARASSGAAEAVAALLAAAGGAHRVQREQVEPAVEAVKAAGQKLGVVVGWTMLAAGAAGHWHGRAVPTAHWRGLSWILRGHCALARNACSSLLRPIACPSPMLRARPGPRQSRLHPRRVRWRAHHGRAGHQRGRRHHHAGPTHGACPALCTQLNQPTALSCLCAHVRAHACQQARAVDAHTRPTRHARSSTSSSPRTKPCS